MVSGVVTEEITGQDAPSHRSGRALVIALLCALLVTVIAGIVVVVAGKASMEPARRETMKPLTLSDRAEPVQTLRGETLGRFEVLGELQLGKFHRTVAAFENTTDRMVSIFGTINLLQQGRIVSTQGLSQLKYQRFTPGRVTLIVTDNPGAADDVHISISALRDESFGITDVVTTGIRGINRSERTGDHIGVDIVEQGPYSKIGAYAMAACFSGDRLVSVGIKEVPAVGSEPIPVTLTLLPQGANTSLQQCIVDSSMRTFHRKYELKETDEETGNA